MFLNRTNTNLVIFLIWRNRYNLWSEKPLITTSCMARKTYKIPYKKSLNFVFKRPEKW